MLRFYFNRFGFDQTVEVMGNFISCLNKIKNWNKTACASYATVAKSTASFSSMLYLYLSGQNYQKGGPY